MKEVLRKLLRPFGHFMEAFERVVSDPPWLSLAAAVAGAAVAWWVYVPVHELAHAFGCMATGGTVDRLEIDARYGAALLQRVFPFVAVGSDYAGQLTGFDTRGSDWIYLATDIAPFLLTIAVGVPLLTWLRRNGRARAGHAFLLGAAVPVAFAPFTNLVGDYYEMGSILVSRVAAWLEPGFAVERWRSDDLPALAQELWDQEDSGVGDAVGLTTGALVGVVLAYTTYFAGTLTGRFLSRDDRPGRSRSGKEVRS